MSATRLIFWSATVCCVVPIPHHPDQHPFRLFPASVETLTHFIHSQEPKSIQGPSSSGHGHVVELSLKAEQYSPWVSVVCGAFASLFYSRYILRWRQRSGDVSLVLLRNIPLFWYLVYLWTVKKVIETSFTTEHCKNRGPLLHVYTHLQLQQSNRHHKKSGRMSSRE